MLEFLSIETINKILKNQSNLIYTFVNAPKCNSIYFLNFTFYLNQKRLNIKKIFFSIDKMHWNKTSLKIYIPFS